jgi:hypothetical protein
MAHERHIDRVHTEPVVLDIGLDTGALVLYTDKALRGKEIELSPKGDATRRVHTDVAERRVNGRSVFAAVFLPLPAGEYTVWHPDPKPPTAVTIIAGKVAEVHWSSPG